MGFTTVDNVEGYFNVEGCADDFDWLIAVKNRPEVWQITHFFDPFLCYSLKEFRGFFWYLKCQWWWDAFIYDLGCFYLQIYIRVHHYCNSPKGEFLKILPTFRVFVPQTYDYHIRFPIELDSDRRGTNFSLFYFYLLLVARKIEAKNMQSIS